MFFLITLLSIFCLWLLVICARAIMFKPAPETDFPKTAPGSIDSQGAIKNLQAMIKVATVSSDPGALKEFRALLPKLYPLLHKHCTYEKVGEGGMLFHWKGKAADKPTVYMSHYDVVPAEEAKWRKPPYSAEYENGEIWGRGTLDTKATLCAALEAAEALLSQGFVPAQDIYFAFGGDEETTGLDALAIVELLKSRNVKPALVLDEGGAVVENVFPGVKQAVALIGSGEKGLTNIRFAVNSQGGHSMAPPKNSPIVVLARAVARLEERPFQARVSDPVRQMFDILGRHSSFAYRLIFANLWCFSGLLALICKKMGGELNAMVRTTCAFTQMQGSPAMNVLPPYAEVVANLRLLPPDTPETALAYVKEQVNNQNITITTIDGDGGPHFSNTDNEGYRRVVAGIKTIWPQAVVSPYLMMARTDSRHFRLISDVVLRFSGTRMSAEDRKTIHGNDERIGEGQFLEMLMFYRQIVGAS